MFLHAKTEKKKSLGGGTSPDLTAVASIIYALRYASGDVIQAVLWLFLLFRISFTWLHRGFNSVCQRKCIHSGNKQKHIGTHLALEEKCKISALQAKNYVSRLRVEKMHSVCVCACVWGGCLPVKRSQRKSVCVCAWGAGNLPAHSSRRLYCPAPGTLSIYPFDFFGSLNRSVVPMYFTFMAYFFSFVSTSSLPKVEYSTG